MPPSRFGSVSAYRNATLTAFNPTERYEELSTSSTSTSNQDVPLTCSLTHLISLNSSPGVINYIRHSNTGKHSNKSPSFNAINGNITDLKVTPYFHSTFNSQLLAVSNQSDSVNVYSLPYTSQDGSDGIQSELREEEKPILVTSFQVENAAQISNLSWHPNAQDLLLVSSSTSNFLVIYHLENGKNPNVAIRLEVDSPVWNADWSQDGKFIVASSKDGLVRVWNPREIQKPLVAFQAHQSKLKPTRSTFVRSSHIVTTGFGSQREREISVWDLSSILSNSNPTSPIPIHSTKLDTSTSILSSKVDQSRGLIFFLSKGDSILRWLEISSASDPKPIFTEGSFPLISSIQTFNLLNEGLLDVMKAEIDRFIMLTLDGKSLIPFGLNVPRRQYIDFHKDLYPDVKDDFTDLEGKDWLVGRDEERKFVGMDLESLKKREERRRGLVNGGSSKTESKASISQSETVVLQSQPQAQTSSNPISTPTIEKQQTREEKPQKAVEEKVPSNPSSIVNTTNGSPNQVEGKAAPVQSSVQSQVETKAVTSQTQSVLSPTTTNSQSQSQSQPQPQPRVSSQPSKSTPASNSNIGSSSIHTPSNPPKNTYSRRFLSGVSALLPTYSSLPNLDISFPPSSKLLTCTSSYWFYPLAGPGGRLAFHPFVKQRRMPEANRISTLEGEGKVVDFLGDKFKAQNGKERVWIARENGRVESWVLPSFEAEDDITKLENLSLELKPSSTYQFDGKISEILSNPITSGLVTILPFENDSKIVFWNSDQENEKLEFELPGGVGIHTGAWNPDGRYLALAGKDGNIRVVDPRDQSGKVGEVKGHSSLRPNRLLWISSSHLISVGHDKSSSRQLILYEFDSESSFSLNEISTLQLDISPSILFPDFDPLTSILFLHSKGARTISSYEVRPEHSTKSRFSVKASTGGGSRFGSNQKEVWNPLPVYQGSEPQLGLAFRSIREVDVKNVEIASSLRIARGEARLVSWKISRNRPEFFQDDIYVPMLADDKPLLKASQWFKGEDGKVENGEILDLKPSNMDLLSKAPALASKSTLPKGPIQRGMTEKEREDAILAGVFNNAKGVNDRKAQEDKEEGVGVTGKWGEEARSRVPDSGDWSDED